ncbi:DUF3105 domain-containing protein [Nocardioides sp.]|uniref:DUF3105 domain-containing protein n=1 Tax=Nocardioides sp. TaxID=35761 RepID=UPI00378493CE
MAKSGKSAKSDRQAVVEQMRKQQQSAERRRSSIIVVVCVAVALAIVAVPAYTIIKNKLDERKYTSKALDQIGAPASACQDIVTKKADGNQNHVPVGTPVDYTTAPPAFGPHWNEAGVAPAPFARKFYTAKDRPELEALVHNLEHGYTILWYDASVADDADQLSQVKAIAAKFEDSSDSFRDKFIAAPWTSDDEGGKAFPDGAHVALTHWSAGGTGETDQAKQLGAFQYCSAPSGAALQTFMEKYPFSDTPEPNAM